MAKINKTRLLVLGIVLLFVTNVATIVGIILHLQGHEYSQISTSVEQNDVNNMPRGQFFKTKLGLNQEQTHIFRDLYHQFKRDAGQISQQMEILRKEMVDELVVENPDTLLLSNVAARIGNLHKQLKELTISYFLEMKKNCEPEQEEKLHQIFNSLLNEQGDVLMPNTQGQHQFGRNRKGHLENDSTN